MKSIIRTSLILWTLCIAACGGGGGSASAPAPPVSTNPPSTPSGPYPIGLSDQSITVGNTVRQFRVHVPANLQGEPSAVVLVLHGGGGPGLDVANTGAYPLAVFRALVDSDRVVVGYLGDLAEWVGTPGAELG